MTTVVFLAFVLSVWGCSAGDRQQDTSFDSSVADMQAEDMATVGDGAEEDSGYRRCLRGECRCERGEYFAGAPTGCTTLAGCSAFEVSRKPERGCVFYPGTQGRVTEAECETDSDCANSPHGPHCILRGCHPRSEECFEDSDCAGGEVCIGRAICMPPLPACETHADCEDPGFCSPDFDGMGDYCV